MNNHTEVVINEMPLCDFCLQEKDNFPASFDGKTKMGAWANMCEKHFRQYGIGLGLGKGQKLMELEK